MGKTCIRAFSFLLAENYVADQQRGKMAADTHLTFVPPSFHSTVEA